VDTAKYMADEAFWATDKITCVLSMFGRRAPVFSTGTTLRKMTIVAKGEGSNTAPAYDPKPPTYLQVTQLPLVNAVPTWRGLLQTGMAKGNWESEVRGAVQFRGAAKADLWVSLNNHLKDSIGLETSGGGGAAKRAAEGEIEESEEQGTLPTQKKRKGGFSFFKYVPSDATIRYDLTHTI
jgi:hypothetical protein